MQRIKGIDILRGFIILKMILSHLFYFFLSYFPFATISQTENKPFLFLYDMITNFAPIFVFLAGISIYFYAKEKINKDVTKFLLTRGICIIIIEIFVISFAWTSQLYPIFFEIFGIIGISFIILSFIRLLSYRLQVIIAILSVNIHTFLYIFDVIIPEKFINLWAILYAGGEFSIGNILFSNLSYTIIPWFGILLTGYVFAPYLKKLLIKKYLLSKIGLILISIHFIFNILDMVIDTQYFSLLYLSLFETDFYPPSLINILFALGVSLIFIELFEKTKHPIYSIGLVIGKTPLVSYILHLYLILISVLIIGFFQGHSLLPFKYSYWNYPEQFGIDIPYIILVWFCISAIIYFIAKRYRKLKEKYTIFRYL